MTHCKSNQTINVALAATALAVLSAVQAQAISAFDAPAFGARAIPVILDGHDGPGGRGLRYGVDPLTPAPSGCGDLSSGAVYVDLPGVAVPAPSGEGATGVGSDMVVAPRFVVHRAPGGDAPRDALAAVSVDLGGLPVGEPGARGADTPVEAIEADPRAHLDAPLAFFPAYAAAGDGAARIVPATFVTPEPSAQPLHRLVAAPSGGAGARDGGAVVLPAAALDAEAGSTWLYPAVSPGYLQELDLKGTITFASFRAPVSIDATLIDCAPTVGADIVEAAFVPDTPLLDTPPGPSFFDRPPVVLASAPVVRQGAQLSNGSPRPPRNQSFGSGTNTFIGGGGGSDDGGCGGEDEDPSCSQSNADATDPSPIPLPAAGLLYGGAALLAGASLSILRRRTA